MQSYVQATSCVPGFDALAHWSGQACALWPTRTPAEKQQWVLNYLQAHGRMANQVTITSLIQTMDIRCSRARPAGLSYDTIGAAVDEANQGDSNQPSEGERIATDRNVNQTLQTGINAIANTTLGIFQADKGRSSSNPGIGGNPLGFGGGLQGLGQSGVSGGFNSPYGYGGGAISWTPILVGGVIVVGLIMLVVSTQRRAT
jgi:hypothetical protein